jgi:hypothetical protein
MGTRMVLGTLSAVCIVAAAVFLDFHNGRTPALWKTCRCAAAPSCVTVSKRRHPAATDGVLRHAMSINQVPSSGMHFAPKTNTQMLVWFWITDFTIQTSREQSRPADPTFAEES